MGERRRPAWRGRAAGALVALALIMVVAASGTPADAAGTAGSSPGSASAGATGPTVSTEVEDAVADGGRAFVIANLAAPANAPQAIESTGRSVLEQLTEGSYQGEAEAQSLPFMALEVDATALADLRQDPNVTSVVLNHMNVVSLSHSVPAVGGDVVHDFGYDGAGGAVAIVDTGVDRTHPFLSDDAGQSRVVAEGCFSGLGGQYVNVRSLCPGGTTSEVGVGAAAPCDASECTHGTHVAGIAAGGRAANNGVTEPRAGMAPSASIIAAQVFSEICPGMDPVTFVCPPGGWQTVSFDSDIALALQWVDGLRSTIRVAAVNLSVGTEATFTADCNSETILATSIWTLHDHWIPTVVASGNGGAKTGISSPACVTQAISVGSWDSALDDVSSFSNSSPSLTLLAPGDRGNGGGIVSSVPGGYEAQSGTSMAAPHVAAAFALMAQAYGEQTVSHALAHLTERGVPVTDTNGVTTPRLRIDTALLQAPSGTVGGFSGIPWQGFDLWVNVNLRGIPAPTIAMQWYQCPTPTDGPVDLPPGCVALVGEESASHTVSADDVGSYLTFRVAATNGLEPDFVVSRSTGLVRNTPTATSVDLKAGDQTIGASWHAPYDAGSPVTGYRVTLTPTSPAGGSTVVDLSSATLSYQFAGLVNGATYQVVVQAANANGLGEPSFPVSATPFTSPGAPTILGTTAGDGRVIVDIGPPAWDGGSPISAYLVTASPGGATCSAFVAVGTCVVTGLTNGTPYTFTVRTSNGAGPGPFSEPSAPVTPRPGYHPVVPARIMDTRAPAQGGATVDGQDLGTGALSSGAIRTLTVAGRGELPASGVSAVALNVTVAGSSGSGFLTVFPSGVTAPNASNLNFAAGQVVPNMVLTEVGADGKIAIRNFGGNTQVIVDVVGWYREGAPYDPIVPSRYLDTRTPANGGATFDGTNVATGALASGETRLVKVTGRGDGRVPESGVAAVALNVTVAGSTGSGFLTVFPSGVTAPNASNLNFVAGQVVPNMVLTKVGADGKIAIRNYGGNTQVIVDVVGWVSEAGATGSLVPARLMDTRSPSEGAATIDGLVVGTGSLAPGEARTLTVAGRGGVPLAGASAVALNVTVAGSSGPGFLTIYPSDVVAPNASNLNFVAGQVVPNMVIAKLSRWGSITIRNSSGTTPVVVDVVGWYP